MTFHNKLGSCSMTNSVDIVANSISLIQSDGTLQNLTGGNNSTGTGTGITKESLGLGNVDNVSDMNKPISLATQSALNINKVHTNATFTSHLNMINNTNNNLSTLNNSINNNLSQLNSSINNTFTSHLNLINNTNTNLSTLTTSINNTFTSNLALINNTFTSHLNLINSNGANLSTLTTSLNNTFLSHLNLINANGSNHSALSSSFNNFVSSTNNNINTVQQNTNNNTGSITNLNNTVSNINSTISSQLPTYATQTYVNNAVSNLVGSAPESLNTLQELATAIAANENLSTSIVNSIANVGITASTALTTAKSILTVLPSFATLNYVHDIADTKQPLDETGTLEAIPINISTTDSYFLGFPTDQPVWGVLLDGASYNNVFSLNGDSHQLITLPSSTARICTNFPNTFPYTICRVGFSVKLGTSTSVSIKVMGEIDSLGLGTPLAIASFWANLSSSYFTNVEFEFQTPNITTIDSLYLVLSGSAGTLCTKNWSIYAGSSITTRIRGNLSVPYGKVSSSDFLYGPNGISLSNSMNTTNTILTSHTASINSINNTIPNLAPIESSNIIRANGFVANGGITAQQLNLVGNINILGDIVYGLMQRSFLDTISTLTSQVATLTSQMELVNSRRQSGSINGTTTYQQLYVINLGTRGFITAVAYYPNHNMFTGFFDWTTSGSWPSLTRIAQSGKATQADVNTTSASSAGVVNLYLRKVGDFGLIEARVDENSKIDWWVQLI